MVASLPSSKPPRASPIPSNILTMEEQQQQAEALAKEVQTKTNGALKRARRSAADDAQKPSKHPKTTTEAPPQEESKGRQGVKLKRRKLALFVAYCGIGYQGMQRNPGAKTIEGDLEEALFKAGAIPEDLYGNPKKLDWMRAARTDKGVSALGQVVSGYFLIHEPQEPSVFVDKINSHLPETIRVLGFQRVTPSFSAKNFCDRRRYEYVLPLFALDPASHRDRESAPDSNYVVAMVNCECSDRGRKVPGLIGRRLEDGTIVNEKVQDEAQPQENPNSESQVNLENPNKVDSESDNDNVDVEDPKKSPEQGIAENNGQSFSYSEKEKERFNKILSQFVGTHNFHNFTARTKAEDPAAKRYIVSFEASDAFEINGVEFVKCTVLGQSFMLHQIRKMIGLAVSVMRNAAPESAIPRALRRDMNMTIPTAPEVGLFLVESLFPAYNDKWQSIHGELSVKGLEKQISEFKHKHIYSHIASTEVKEGTVGMWLHSLNQRNYVDFAVAWEEERAKGKAELL